MLYKQEELLNNSEYDPFFHIFFAFQISGGPRGLILDHFLHNSEPPMVSEIVNEVRWHVVLRFLLEKLHNL